MSEQPEFVSFEYFKTLSDDLDRLEIEINQARARWEMLRGDLTFPKHKKEEFVAVDRFFDKMDGWFGQGDE